jgi:Transposase DDE domain
VTESITQRVTRLLTEYLDVECAGQQRRSAGTHPAHVALLHRSAVGEVGPIGIGGRPLSGRRPTMPFKANAARRHHIPKQKKRKLTNWAAYDASLRQRASLTVWFTDDAIAGWKAESQTTRGGQAWYSPLAILTALTLRAVFRLALRQTEGLIDSLITLLGLTLPRELQKSLIHVHTMFLHKQIMVA